MKFSNIKVAFLVLASLALGAEGQKGKGKWKCVDCIIACVVDHDEILKVIKGCGSDCAKSPKCDIKCDKCSDDALCLAKCQEKKIKCTAKCTKTCLQKKKEDDDSRLLLNQAKADCERDRDDPSSDVCKIDAVCNVETCNDICDCADGSKTCKRACKKCRNPLIKGCQDTCVYDEDRCGCSECTSCAGVCNCARGNPDYAECKVRCKECNNNNNACLETCFANDPTKKECVGKCICDNPLKAHERKGGGGEVGAQGWIDNYFSWFGF